jgi:hypothetical protein
MTDNKTTVEQLRRQLQAIKDSMVERKGQEGILLVSREAYEKVYNASQALPKRWFSTFDTEFKIETYKRGAVTCKKVILPDGSFYTQKEVVHGFVAIQNAIQIVKEYGLS